MPQRRSSGGASEGEAGTNSAFKTVQVGGE
jgi:hypothetical protein